MTMKVAKLAVPLLLDDHMIEQIAAAAADETFGHAILPRAPILRLD